MSKRKCVNKNSTSIVKVEPIIETDHISSETEMPLAKRKCRDVKTILVEKFEPTIKTEQTAAYHSKKMLAKSGTKEEKYIASKYKRHKCPDCDYSTDKRNALSVHRSEFCITPPVKDRKCKYCLKDFTRRALRVHLDQYVPQNMNQKANTKTCLGQITRHIWMK